MKRIRALLSLLIHTDYVALTKELMFFSRFFALIVFFLIFGSLGLFFSLPILSKLTAPIQQKLQPLVNKALSVFNYKAEGEISSLDLINLAVKHLSAKKTRTFITVGGMSIGFGSIIFLLSLGYGTQRLVISRVARLDELKQINVTVGQASSLNLNDKVIEQFTAMDKVKTAVPLVSIVSKVAYNNSVSDAIGYGASKEYLEQSAIQMLRGKVFENTEVLSQAPVYPTGAVAGAETERQTGAKLYKQTAQVRYSPYPLEWKAVHAQPSEDSDVLGYTSRVVGNLEAIELWGELYAASGNLPEGIDAYGTVYMPWIKSDFPLWQKTECSPDAADCVEGDYQVLKAASVQKIAEGYITETNVAVERYKILASQSQTPVDGGLVQPVSFSLKENDWIAVHSEDWKSSAVEFYTTATASASTIQGDLVYGEAYPSSRGWGNAGTNKNGKELGYWVQATVPIWWKLSCEDCGGTYLPETTQDGSHRQALVLLRADQLKIDDLPEPPAQHAGAVLGIATESASLTSGTDSATISGLLASAEIADTQIVSANGLTINPVRLDDGTIEWVTTATDSATALANKKSTIPFPENSQKVAIVNSSLLSVHNIPESEAVGKSFSVTLVFDADQFADPKQAESESTDLTIIGVIPGNKTPSFYLPISDVQNMGIANYSQITVVVESQDDLKAVRKQIEAMGFRTASVVDTVNKITSLFSTVRLLLSLLGFVALGVAALGMFNTLTVSLLEKTREVGLMKAIGMKSNEVKRLFLAESILMGLSGGLLGLLLSFIVGNVISFLLSTLSVSKGLGYINLVYIPPSLAIIIIVLAFLIGILTGMYPSYRATKISALNALRYE